MKTVTVRLNDEESRNFLAYAEVMGMPLSTLFKKTLEEKLEDEYDLKIIEEYEKDLEDGNVETRPIDDFFKELGL